MSRHDRDRKIRDNGCHGYSSRDINRGSSRYHRSRSPARNTSHTRRSSTLLLTNGILSSSSRDGTGSSTQRRLSPSSRDHRRSSTYSQRNTRPLSPLLIRDGQLSPSNRNVSGNDTGPLSPLLIRDGQLSPSNRNVSGNDTRPLSPLLIRDGQLSPSNRIVSGNDTRPLSTLLIRDGQLSPSNRNVPGNDTRPLSTLLIRDGQLSPSNREHMAFAISTNNMLSDHRGESDRSLINSGLTGTGSQSELSLSDERFVRDRLNELNYIQGRSPDFDSSYKQEELHNFGTRFSLESSDNLNSTQLLDSLLNLLGDQSLNPFAHQNRIDIREENISFGDSGVGLNRNLSVYGESSGENYISTKSYLKDNFGDHSRYKFNRSREYDITKSRSRERFDRSAEHLDRRCKSGDYRDRKSRSRENFIERSKSRESAGRKRSREHLRSNNRKHRNQMNQREHLSRRSNNREHRDQMKQREHNRRSKSREQRDRISREHLNKRSRSMEHRDQMRTREHHNRRSKSREHTDQMRIREHFSRRSKNRERTSRSRNHGSERSNSRELQDRPSRNKEHKSGSRSREHQDKTNKDENSSIIQDDNSGLKGSREDNTETKTFEGKIIAKSEKVKNSLAENCEIEKHTFTGSSEKEKDISVGIYETERITGSREVDGKTLAGSSEIETYTATGSSERDETAESSKVDENKFAGNSEIPVTSIEIVGNSEMDSNTDAGSSKRDDNLLTGSSDMESNTDTGSSKRDDNLLTGSSDMESNTDTGSSKRDDNLLTGSSDMESNTDTGSSKRDDNLLTGISDMESNTEAGSSEMDGITLLIESSKMDSNNCKGKNEKDGVTLKGSSEITWNTLAGSSEIDLDSSGTEGKTLTEMNEINRDMLMGRREMDGNAESCELVGNTFTGSGYGKKLTENFNMEQKAVSSEFDGNIEGYCVDLSDLKVDKGKQYIDDVMVATKIADGNDVMEHTKITNVDDVMGDTKITNEDDVMGDTKITNGNDVMEDTKITNVDDVMENTKITNVDDVMGDTKITNEDDVIGDTRITSEDDVIGDTKIANENIVIGDIKIKNEGDVMGDTKITNEDDVMEDTKITNEDDVMGDTKIINEDVVMEDTQIKNEDVVMEDTKIINEDDVMGDSKITNEDDVMGDSKITNEDGVMGHIKISNEDDVMENTQIINEDAELDTEEKEVSFFVRSDAEIQCREIKKEIGVPVLHKANILIQLPTKPIPVYSRVTIYRENGPTIIAVENGNVITTDSYKGRVKFISCNTSGVVKLQIHHVKLEDGGVYMASCDDMVVEGPVLKPYIPTDITMGIGKTALIMLSFNESLGYQSFDVVKEDNQKIQVPVFSVSSQNDLNIEDVYRDRFRFHGDMKLGRCWFELNKITQEDSGKYLLQHESQTLSSQNLMVHSYQTYCQKRGAQKAKKNYRDPEIIASEINLLREYLLSRPDDIEHCKLLDNAITNLKLNLKFNYMVEVGGNVRGKTIYSGRLQIQPNIFLVRENGLYKKELSRRVYEKAVLSLITKTPEEILKQIDPGPYQCTESNELKLEIQSIPSYDEQAQKAILDAAVNEGIPDHRFNEMIRYEINRESLSEECILAAIKGRVEITQGPVNYSELVSKVAVQTNEKDLNQGGVNPDTSHHDITKFVVIERSHVVGDRKSFAFQILTDSANTCGLMLKWLVTSPVYIVPKTSLSVFRCNIWLVDIMIGEGFALQKQQAIRLAAAEALTYIYKEWPVIQVSSNKVQTQNCLSYEEIIIKADNMKQREGGNEDYGITESGVDKWFIRAVEDVLINYKNQNVVDPLRIMSGFDRKEEEQIKSMCRNLQLDPKLRREGLLRMLDVEKSVKPEDIVKYLKDNNKSDKYTLMSEQDKYNVSEVIKREIKDKISI